MKKFTPAERRARVEQNLMDELRAFIDELERCQPSWEDGLVHSITIEGAVAAHADDEPLYDFRVSRKQEKIL